MRMRILRIHGAPAETPSCTPPMSRIVRAETGWLGAGGEEKLLVKGLDA